MNFIISIILFLSPLISYSKCKDEIIEFYVEKIEISQVSCIPKLGTYLFYIIGEFSSSPNIKKLISLNFQSSNFKAICRPLEQTLVSKDQLQCEINVCDYPINDENIFLPINPPNTDGYEFPNWNKVISKFPGESNKIPEDNIICIPMELNSYNISSIKSEGCSNKKNIILIDGKWSDESQLLPKSFEIILNNGNQAKCETTNLKQIQCEIDGYGDIKFNEKYFKSGINVFKIEDSDKSISIDKCNLSSFIIFDKIILFLIMFLF